MYDVWVMVRIGMASTIVTYIVMAYTPVSDGASPRGPSRIDSLFKYI